MDEKSTPAIGKKMLAGALAIGAVFGVAGIANAATQDDSTPTPTTQIQDDSVQLQADDGEDGIIEDESLEVESIEDDDHEGEHDRDHDDDHDDDRHDRDHDSEWGDHEDDHTPLDPAVAEQVTAAAQLAVPGGTVTKVEREDAGFEAHVIGTDGVEVEVYFDADMNVIAID